MPLWFVFSLRDSGKRNLWPVGCFFKMRLQSSLNIDLGPVNDTKAGLFASLFFIFP